MTTHLPSDETDRFGASPRRNPVARVTLLRPAVVVMPRSLATHGPTPPIGLAYIAGVLRAAGHAVKVVDGTGEAVDRCVAFLSPVGTLHRLGLSPAEIVERIAPDTEIIGITNMFLHEWPQVREIAALAKRRVPGAFVVVGGENATAFARWILAECAAVDCCVLGEGEATILELVRRLTAAEPLRAMPGLAVRDEITGDVVCTGPPTRLAGRELKALPPPAWDLVPLDRYWSTGPFLGVNRGRSMQVIGTRGCPYACSFCSSPQMWSTRFVVREPPDAVADEIVDYARRYGVRNINFVDLTAATNRKWTLDLCDALERRAPDVTWQLPVGTRTEGIDRQVLHRMRQTGCRNIVFAPESGSPRMLEAMNKPSSLSRLLAAVRDAHRVGLRTTVNIIVGHPQERWADLWMSLKFLLKAAWAGGDDTAVIMFCPYPGSADFDALVESGRHVVDEASLYVGLSRSSSSHRSWNERMSARQVRLAQMLMTAAFYGAAVLRRPVRVVEFVRAQVTGHEETYLDQMVRTRRQEMRPAAHTAGSLGKRNDSPQNKNARPASGLTKRVR